MCSSPTFEKLQKQKEKETIEEEHREQERVEKETDLFEQELARLEEKHQQRVTAAAGCLRKMKVAIFAKGD